MIVTHLMDAEHKVTADPAAGRFTVEGVFSVRQRKLSSPLKVIIFRLVNLTASRFFPNLIRAFNPEIIDYRQKPHAVPFPAHDRVRPEAVRIRDEFPGAIPSAGFRRVPTPPRSMSPTATFTRSRCCASLAPCVGGRRGGGTPWRGGLGNDRRTAGEVVLKIILPSLIRPGLSFGELC